MVGQVDALTEVTIRAWRDPGELARGNRQLLAVLPVGGNLGYAVTILSYNHDRYIAMAAQQSRMPDLDRMRDHVQAVFEELKLAANLHTTRRRATLNQDSK